MMAQLAIGKVPSGLYRKMTAHLASHGRMLGWALFLPHWAFAKLRAKVTKLREDLIDVVAADFEAIMVRRLLPFLDLEWLMILSFANIFRRGIVMHGRLPKT